jgi:uncharacterized membrane protein YgcG
MSTEQSAAASVPALEEDVQARGRGRQIAIVAAVAVVVALAAFLIGRLGGSSEKTVHVKQGARSHSVVVVPRTSARVSSLATGSIAPLVAPPQTASSGGSSSSPPASSSSGGSSSGGSSSGGGVIVGGG